MKHSERVLELSCGGGKQAGVGMMMMIPLTLRRALFLFLFLCVLPGSQGQVNESVFFACKNCINQPIRVMFLHSPLFMENYDAPGNGGGCGNADSATQECFIWDKWNDGFIGATVARILKELNPPKIVAMTVANFSADVYSVYTGGSSFTRCVHEIRLGNVDMCAGNFWETVERRRLAPFSSHIFTDSIKLTTLPLDFRFKKQDFAGEETVEDTFDYSIFYRNILQPFTPEVWYVTLAMFIFGGLMMWLCNFNADDPPLPAHVAPEGIGGAFKSIWVSFMGFVCASPAHQPTGFPGRIVMLGYGFFIYVSVVLYVSNLSAFLALQRAPSQTPGISSIAQIARLGGKVCVLESLSELIAASVPRGNQKLFDKQGAAFENLYRGGCLATVSGSFEYDQFVRAQSASFTACVDPADENGNSVCQDKTKQAVKIDLNCKCPSNPSRPTEGCKLDCPYGIKRFCPFQQVVDPSFVLQIPMSLPLAPFLQNPVSAWIVLLKNTGFVESNIKMFVQNQICDVCGKSYTSDSCNVTQRTSKIGPIKKVDQLDIEYMAGIYVWAAIGIMLGGLVSLASRGWGKAQAIFRWNVPVEEGDIDVHGRDADISKLIKDNDKFSAQHVDSIVFERKLETHLDEITTQMDSIMARMTGEIEALKKYE